MKDEKKDEKKEEKKDEKKDDKKEEEKKEENKDDKKKKKEKKADTKEAAKRATALKATGIDCSKITPKNANKCVYSPSEEVIKVEVDGDFKVRHTKVRFVKTEE